MSVHWSLSLRATSADETAKINEAEGLCQLVKIHKFGL